MNYEPDDPRLTAYALNELDESERHEIDAHLLEDPAARRLVEEIRAASELLSAELKKESAPALKSEQRAAIQAKALFANPQPTKRFNWKPLVASVAALLVV